MFERLPDYDRFGNSYAPDPCVRNYSYCQLCEKYITENDRYYSDYMCDDCGDRYYDYGKEDEENDFV